MMGHPLASHPLRKVKRSALPRQGVSDGIVHLRQPNVATAWKLLFVQGKGQGVVSHLHFQSFSVKVKPSYRSAASASVFVRPAHATSIPIGTDWSRFSCIVCLTACRAFRFMPSRTVPMDWGMDVLVIISCPFMKNIPSKETVGIRLRPCPARRLHR